MEITILIDNNANNGLVAEHGLSVYVKIGKYQLLIDTGLTGKAFSNAKILGIDVSKVDYLILSHGHKDHSGGLCKFLEINSKAKIIASKFFTYYDYWSNRGGGWHSLSPDFEIIKNNISRFIFVDENLFINNYIGVVTSKNQKFETPNGNRFLFVNKNGEKFPYTANDELALTIKKDKKVAIISPCSHSGLLNISESCCNALNCNALSLFVGGLHLLDGENDDIGLLTTKMLQFYPNIVLYTGHCTGKNACKLFGQFLNNKFHVFASGDVIYF